MLWRFGQILEPAGSTFLFFEILVLCRYTMLTSAPTFFCHRIISEDRICATVIGSRIVAGIELFKGHCRTCRKMHVPGNFVVVYAITQYS